MRLKELLIEEQETREALDRANALEGLSTYGAMCTLADKIAFELYEQATGSASQVLEVEDSKTFNEFVSFVYDRLSSKYAL